MPGWRRNCTSTLRATARAKMTPKGPYVSCSQAQVCTGPALGAHLSCESTPCAEAVRYPHLRRGAVVERVNLVLSCDSTYIRVARGLVYLKALMDRKLS